jgi:hypothetical protein
VLLLSIPAVQTRLGKYATKKLNEDFGTNINIAKVGLQFNGDVELMEIYVEDHHNDTLVSIEELNTSVLSFRKLYNNKLTFGDIDVYGMELFIKTYKDERDTSMDVFVAKFDDNKPRAEGAEPFLMSSSDVSIIDSKFHLIDENKEEAKVFTLNNLNINATDFLVLGPDVNARINKLSFTDDRGISVTDMSTNFTYTLSEMNFDQLKMITKSSTLKGDIKFEYDREDLQHFVDSVQISGNFRDSNIMLSDLDIFFDEFGRNQSINLSADISGTLNNLETTDVIIRTSGRSFIDGDFKFKNSFDKQENTFVMEANLEQLSTNNRDLKSLLPNILTNAIPPIVDNMGRFTIEGMSTIMPQELDIDVEISSELGLLISRLHIQNLDTTVHPVYKGNLIMDDFDIGVLLNDENLGKISFNVDLDGTGFTLESLNSSVNGDVYSIGYNNYEYNRVRVGGNVRNKIFDGNLVVSDPNIIMDFNGLVDFSENVKKYDFTANVEHANLRTLNFSKNDTVSVLTGNVRMNMNASNMDDAVGSVRFRNTNYKNQNDEYYFEDFAISSRFEDDVRFIEINSPDIMRGSLNGKFVFDDVIKLVDNSLGSIYANYQPHDIASDQFINFKFNIYNTIAEIFIPDLELGNNTFFEGRVESNAQNFELVFNSPKIKLKDYYVDDIHLEIDNSNPIYNTFIQVDSINNKHYDVTNLSLINVTKNDTLFIKTDFKGGTANTDNFDLNLFYTINEENKSVLGFRKSNVTFKNNEWYINEKKDEFNKVEFDRNFRDITLKALRLSHDDEIMNLYGVVKDSTTKNINLDFDNVELAKITPVIDSLSLAGSVNGKLNITQNLGVYIPTSNITIDNFKVNDFNLGSFNADISGNQSLTNYSVDVTLKEDDNETLAVTGNLDFSDNRSTINLDIDFDKFILDPLNPFGEGVITNIRGEISGNASVVGRLQRPQINGELSLDGGGLSIPYLNIDYGFEDETIIDLERQSFIFNNARLTDSEFFSRATLSGNIDHVNLSNWRLNLDINSDRLLVLNTDYEEDALYYGRAFVAGNIGVQGPTDQLVINAEVSSEEGTVFNIPMTDSETFGDNTFIRIISEQEKYAQVSGEQEVLDQVKGLEMNFDLDVNENAEIEIIMDRGTGSSIKGRGNGGLLTRITTNGVFEMYGDFFITEGSYNFNYENVIEREFRVVPGGTLVWEGDPLKAEVNIEAVYDQIRANPSVLLENPINQSIPVAVKIHLTEELEKPTIDYDLSFPNVNSTLNSELQYRLNDRDSKELQVISLLVTGAFRNELSFGSQDAFGLFTDRLESMLNEIFTTADGKVNLGLDLQLGQATPDFETDSRVGVTLSTKLSDNILVNGQVGVPIGGVSETVIAGNFEVEMLINEDRTLSLKFFNRENSIRYFGEQIGYTQGIGLSYNVEFDNLKELFKKVFSKKEKNDKVLEAPSSKFSPDFINYKKADAKKTTKINN